MTNYPSPVTGKATVVKDGTDYLCLETGYHFDETAGRPSTPDTTMVSNSPSQTTMRALRLVISTTL